MLLNPPPGLVKKTSLWLDQSSLHHGHGQSTSHWHPHPLRLCKLFWPDSRNPQLGWVWDFHLLSASSAPSVVSARLPSASEPVSPSHGSSLQGRPASGLQPLGAALFSTEMPGPQTLDGSVLQQAIGLWGHRLPSPGAPKTLAGQRGAAVSFRI